MRYSYGLTSALLVGGAAISLITGSPVGAQVAQNDDSQMARVVPRAGAPESFADLTAQLQPAVVNISTRQRIQVQTGNPFAGTPFEGLFGNRGAQPQTRQAQSLGSGFIISADGYVVTNNHVIAPQGRGEVEEITVTMIDGIEYSAKLVGNDAASDLAVLKIDAPKTLPFVEFGDSRQARVGDWVIAIGNPFALGGTVTSGIVSAVYRNTGTGGAYDRYIQTDASINRGNSGGPLFDMQGNVIGINNAIFSPSGGSVGIGFAIPADIAAPIVDKLRRGQEIARGYLGISIEPVTGDLADALGLPQNRGEFVQSVEPGQPAERAGLRPGDVVTKVNNQEVTGERTLSFIVANIAPGTRIPIEYLRRGERQTVQVTVGKRPSEDEIAQSQLFGSGDDGAGANRPGGAELGGVLWQALGVQVVQMTPRFAQQLGVSADRGGLVVLDVDTGSDAAQKGIVPGTIIREVNETPVNSERELEAIVSRVKASGRDSILLTVQPRGGRELRRPVRLR